jgi:hypothetical protein
MKKNPTTQERSADRRLIERALLEVPVEGVITVKALNDLCPGRDFRAKDASMLHRVFKALCRDEGYVFDNVRGVGYKRADDTAKASGTTLGVKRARRIMRHHVINRAAAIENLAAVPIAARAVAIVNASIAAAVNYATKSTTLKNLGASVGDAKVLPPVETLRLLAERTGK